MEELPMKAVRMKNLRKHFFLAGAFLAAWPALATQYILEIAPGTNVEALASKYQFTVVKSFQSTTQISYFVTSTQTLPALSIEELSSEPGVREVEADSRVETPENTQAPKKAKLEPLGTLFATRQAADYYGSRVLATYVTQPGTAIIEL